MTSGANPARLHLPALDGVRGIAILLVMLFHVPRFDTCVPFGWIGVDLFFVLSGFLITNVLLDADPHRARTFCVRRALRILPLGYGAIILALVVMPYLTNPRDPGYRWFAEHQVWWWAYTVNWPMARMWGLKALPSLTLSHFWSLAVEEQFYLLWPFVIWFTSRSTARGSRGPRSSARRSAGWQSCWAARIRRCCMSGRRAGSMGWRSAP